MNKRRYPIPNFKLVSVNEAQKEEPKWLTAKEAADHLRVKVASIHNMVYRRQIASYRVGSRLRFKRQELDMLIEASRKRGPDGN